MPESTLRIRKVAPRRGPIAWLLAALGVLALAAPALPATGSQDIDRHFDSQGIRTVELENLAGEVVLVAADGPSIRVGAHVAAEDSAGETADSLAAALSVDMQTSGDKLVVKAVYPVDRFDHYRYPGNRSGSDAEDHWLLSWLGGSNSEVQYQNRRIRVSSSGSGAALWADFRLEIPAGVAVTVKNSVGRVVSTGVRADQRLDTASGDIDVRDSSGSLSLDTGSGDVTVRQHDGAVDADTGSGDVVFEGVKGDKIAADTGSGNVNLLDCSGALDADTGSGDVRGRGLVLGPRVHIDTGSGDVRLAGDFGSVNDLYIDTGSGDVVLDVAKAPSVHLVVSTGSGDIDVDLPDMRVRRYKRDFIADVGSAEGKATVDTGSGDVTIHGAR
jgi:hypothetical protein